MRKNVILLAMMMGAFLASSCSSDDNGASTNHPTANEIIQVVSSGTWRITSYIDSGNDETADFAGYNFAFTASTNIVAAANGTDTYSGIWSVENDSDDDEPHDIDFNLAFTAPSPQSFIDLSDDWDILEHTATKIRLIDVSGGNGGTDYLTFEKNP